MRAIVSVNEVGDESGNSQSQVLTAFLYMLFATFLLALLSAVVMLCWGESAWFLFLGGAGFVAFGIDLSLLLVEQDKRLRDHAASVAIVLGGLVVMAISYLPVPTSLL